MGGELRDLGSDLPYVDGAEDRILRALRATADRSSLSEELARAIVDWPTRYHLSRHRSNLLRPFRIEPGTRVLEVGAGTGALTRYLGEVGAEVLAVEGSRPRAEAAALRCADLGGVTVAAGDLADLGDEDPFNLVTLVGVLEYAGAAAGGSRGAEAMLAAVAGRMRPDGTLLLAIENRLGLPYLLGAPEDHLGEPWTGVEGYPHAPGVATWSRRGLEKLLRANGLQPAAWLYPFPDYKLPRVVLADAVYDQPDAPDLVDALVGQPIGDHQRPLGRPCDERRAHREMVEAGIGREVAPSLVVLARLDDSPTEALLDGDILAWHFGGARRTRWLRTKVVHVSAGERRIRAVRRAPEIPLEPAGWLSQRPDREQPFFVGPTLEQLALNACHRGDMDDLEAVLRDWAAALDDDAVDAAVDAETGSHAHPFAPAGGAALPADHLDVELSNFVLAEDGFHLVDREWVAAGGVDRTLTAHRALWYLAHRLVLSGTATPWPVTTTVDELAEILARMAGLSLPPDAGERLEQSEAQLQTIVTGVDPGELARRHRHQGALSRASDEVRGKLPTTRLREELTLLRSTQESAAAYQAEIEAEVHRLRSGREDALAHIRGLEDEIARLHAGNEEAARYTRGVEEELARAAAYVKTVEDALADAALDRRNLSAELERVAEWARSLESSAAGAGSHHRAIAGEMERTGAWARDIEHRFQTLQENAAHLQGELRLEQWARERADAEIIRLRAELDDLGDTARKLRGERDWLRLWRDGLLARWPVRLYRSVRRWWPR